MKRFLTMAIAAVLFVGVAPLQAASQIDFAGYYAGFYLSEGNYSRNAAFAGAGGAEIWDPTAGAAGTGAFVPAQAGNGYLGNVGVDMPVLGAGGRTGVDNTSGAPVDALRDYGYFGSGGTNIQNSGIYQAIGATGNNYKTSNHKDSDSYFLNKFNIDVKFTASDEIAIYWRLRGPNPGNNNGNGRWGNFNQDDYALRTVYVYGEISQDWGNILVGRMGYQGYGGLKALGYGPVWGGGEFLQTYIFDEGGEKDAILFHNTWDNIGLRAYYQKKATYEVGVGNWTKDADVDKLFAEGTYKWDGGGASLGFSYERDATTKHDLYLRDANFEKGVYDAQNAWFVNPAIMHSWGDISVHSELKAGWSQKDGRLDGVDKVKGSGLGFYLDVDYNYGVGNVTLGGWWVDGHKYDSTKDHDLVGVGGDFYPFLVAYNQNSLGYGNFRNNAAGLANMMVDGGTYVVDFDPSGNINYNVVESIDKNVETPVAGAISNLFERKGMVYQGRTNKGDANHWAVAINGNHAFTDEIKMHYGVAYFGLVEPNFRVADRLVGNGNLTPAVGTSAYTRADGTLNHSWKEQSKDLGWEMDLGVSIDLLDNLRLESTFAYFFNGKAFNTPHNILAEIKAESAANAGDGVYATSWKKPKDTYTWANTLTFSF